MVLWDSQDLSVAPCTSLVFWPSLGLSGALSGVCGLPRASVWFSATYSLSGARWGLCGPHWGSLRALSGLSGGSLGFSGPVCCFRDLCAIVHHSGSLWGPSGTLWICGPLWWSLGVSGAPLDLAGPVNRCLALAGGPLGLSGPVCGSLHLSAFVDRLQLFGARLDLHEVLWTSLRLF